MSLHGGYCPKLLGDLSLPMSVYLVPVMHPGCVLVASAGIAFGGSVSDDLISHPGRLPLRCLSRPLPRPRPLFLSELCSKFCTESAFHRWPRGLLPGIGLPALVIGESILDLSLRSSVVRSFQSLFLCVFVSHRNRNLGAEWCPRDQIILQRSELWSREPSDLLRVTAG